MARDGEIRDLHHFDTIRLGNWACHFAMPSPRPGSGNGVDPNSSLADWIETWAQRTPEAPAFLSPGATLSWADYEESSQQLARAFASEKIRPGERVAVWLPDGPGVHIAFAAGEKAGIPILGVGPRAGTDEVRHLVETTGAVALVSRPVQRETDTRMLFQQLQGQGLPLRTHFVVESEIPTAGLEVNGRSLPPSTADPRLDALLRERRLGPDDLFLLNSTSGTTGMPKCVRHDQRRWMHFHEYAVEAAELGPHDVFLSAIPAPFGFGIWTAHVTPLLLGAPTVLLPSFSPEEALAAVQQYKVTVLAAVSTQFIMMLDSPAMATSHFDSLRVLFTGGEAVPFERAAAFEEQTRARVLQFYGSNETGAVSRTTLSDSRDRRLRTAGAVIPAMNVRLYDESGVDVTASGRGQPGCNGPLLSGGYESNPEADRELAAPGGGFLLGDIVEIDDEGTLTVVGRADDFIIRGGKNISGPAVEEAVASHPAVRLAAVVGMPDPTYGERACAFVELRSGSDLELPDLVDHLRDRGVSVENWPEKLVVTQEIPRGSGGKVAKGVLRREIKMILESESVQKATEID